MATLAADILLLLPAQRMLFAIGALFSLLPALHHRVSGGENVTHVFWPLPLLLLVIIAILLALTVVTARHTALAGSGICCDKCSNDLGCW
ncbi:MAG: hypothetical protein ACSLEN_02285 [Candidatus Malihini olakiniferum]